MSGRDGGRFSRREVAYRVFATEYEDADLEHSDSDEERAPNYVVTPTGARVNRLFVVGVLTEVEPVSDDVLRARVVDPTGAFVVYAGQYQPEAVAFLEDADVPSFVAVTGKARTFQPEGSDQVFTSVRPESMTTVDAGTRDRWTVQAAEHTLARIATMSEALDRDARGSELTSALESDGVQPGLASGIALALAHYATDRPYLGSLREVVVAAVEVVSGSRESVPDLDVRPAEAGSVDVDLGRAPAVAGTVTGPSPTQPKPVDARPSDDRVVPGEDERPESGVEPASSTDELGDFEPSEEPLSATTDEDRYELDEAEREAVEAEFGTEFSTASEVDEPGAAGLETETEPPATEADEPTEPESEPASVASDESAPEPQPGAQSAEEPTATPAQSSPEDAVDLEDAAVDAMTDLDDGDGADRDEVVASVTAAHDVDSEAVESAIQEALMDGRCYEPSDGRLKAI